MKKNRFTGVLLAALIAAGTVSNSALPVLNNGNAAIAYASPAKPTNLKVSVKKESDGKVKLSASWDGSADYYSLEMGYSGLSGHGSNSISGLNAKSYSISYKQNEGETIKYTVKVKSMDMSGTSAAASKSVSYMMTGANTNRIKRLVKKKCKGMSNFKKIRFAHDWLIKNVKYGKGDGLSGHTFAGAIEDGEAVCQGYTLAFSVFMKYMDIPVKMPYNDDHTWNMVKLGGKWYHIDVTWDDPVGMDSITNKHPSYSYFLQSTSKLLKKDRGGDHTYKKSDYPKAASTVYDNDGNTDGYWEAVPGDNSGLRYNNTFKPWKNGKKMS